MTTIQELAFRGALQVLEGASNHILGTSCCDNGCESCQAARIIREAEAKVRKLLVVFLEGGLK
jgi:hypothetical protein